jgi:hypothetical protein
MKFINMYLVGYLVLVIGICLALWQAGVMDDIGPTWLGIGAVLAIGIGIMTAVSSGKPSGTAGVR